MSDGTFDGVEVGRTGGQLEGLHDGTSDGMLEGTSKGMEVGRTGGLSDGISDGLIEGSENWLMSWRVMERQLMPTGFSHSLQCRSNKNT